MSTSAYFGQLHPQAMDSPPFNPVNGSDAEVYAAAYLNIACGGEISWGSREEDGQKIDLLLSLKQAWNPSGRFIVLTQVKSGVNNEYENEKGELRSAIPKQILKDIFTPTHDLLLVWVNRATGSSFWTYVKAGEPAYQRDLGSRNRITPALKFDLCRIIHSRKADGGKGLLFKIRAGAPQEVRKASYQCYKVYAQTGLQSPLFGTIKFTRMGWRHLTRVSRLNLFRQQSQQIIPLLDKLLARSPSYHLVEDCTFSERRHWRYRDTVYLLVYQHVKCEPVDGGKPKELVVYLKIHESIVYPREWKTTVQRGQLVQRECKFLSVYFKEPKKEKKEHTA